MKKVINGFKSRRLRFVLISFLLLVSITLGYLVVHWTESNKNSLTSHSISANQGDERVKNIQKSLESAVSGREDLVAFLIYDVQVDRVDFSEDGKLGLVWLKMTDRNTGEVIPSEPILALATLMENSLDWHITLQSDNDWADRLAQVPNSLLDTEHRSLYQTDIQKVTKGPVQKGYRLPWPGGLAKRVTGSIGHVFVYKTCPDTCLYAFDFADGTMFPVVAARGGRVKAAVWHYPNNQSKHANFIVLEDNSTNPTTYQIYYHLAQDSIPTALRIPGTQVLQGQQIGVADNTGPSTASHLHFHVHTNPKVIWGTSVDIAFDEVAENGGRPRTCAEARMFPNYGSQCRTGNWFVSKNGDAEKPTGGIDQPLAGALVQTRKLNVLGWGKDDTQVNKIQLYMTYDGNWQAIGDPKNGTTYKTTIDICKLGIPDGQFFLSMIVTDKSGKNSDRVGMTALQKQYNCAGPTPTPTATPKVCLLSPDQVSVFVNPQFQGNCNQIGIGNYSTAKQFGLGDNAIDSIQVGENVIAILYSENNFKGQSEVFQDSGPDLSDHKIKRNQVSSIKVISRPSLPIAPEMVNPQASQDQPLSEDDNLILRWNGNGGDEYHADLIGKDGWKIARDWSATTTWKVGKLSAGDYKWTVQARNLAGIAQSEMNFAIQPADQAPTTHLEPLPAQSTSTALLIKWVVEKDVQDLGGFQLQFRKKGSDWQNWQPEIKADQRQIWFIGEPGWVYQFRLRAVDVHGQLEAFTSESDMEIKLPNTCSGDSAHPAENNEDWSNASTLDPGQNMYQKYCKVGESHWFVFPSQVGKRYKIIVQSSGGGAASRIQLYANDHVELLGESSPEGLGQNTELVWTAPEDGLRYVKLTAIDKKLLGSNVRYKIEIQQAEKVFTPKLFLGGLLLPIVWYFTKLWKRWKEKPAEQQGIG